MAEKTLEERVKALEKHIETHQMAKEDAEKAMTRGELLGDPFLVIR